MVSYTTDDQENTILPISEEKWFHQRANLVETLQISSQLLHWSDIKISSQSSRCNIYVDRTTAPPIPYMSVNFKRSILGLS